MAFDNDDKSTSTSGFGSKEDAPADQPKSPFLKVGEREFAAPDDVTTHISAAQEHIAKLEKENQEMREREAVLQKAAEDNMTARELLEGIQKATSTPKPSETPSVDKEELIAEAVRIATTTVEHNLRSEAERRAADTNLADAEEAAKKAYGDSYKAKIIELGNTHGLTGKQIDNLAKQSPAAFKSLFIPTAPASSGPTDGSLNTGAFQQPPKDEKPKRIMAATSNKERAAIIESRILAKTLQSQST